jgi:hypothetical protein
LAGHLLADWFPEYLDINILGVLHMYIIKWLFMLDKKSTLKAACRLIYPQGKKP